MENAEIVDTFFGIEHSYLTLRIYLKGYSWTQSFGGIVFNGNGEIMYIKNILDTLEVNSLENLKGTNVRVIRRKNGHIKEIGHIVKDRWTNIQKISKYLIEQSSRLMLTIPQMKQYKEFYILRDPVTMEEYPLLNTLYDEIEIKLKELKEYKF